MVEGGGAHRSCGGRGGEKGHLSCKVHQFGPDVNCLKGNISTSCLEPRLHLAERVKDVLHVRQGH